MIRRNARPARSTKAGIDFSTDSLPFETEALRAALTEFLDKPVGDPITRKPRKLGSFKWGVYAFFDYNGEPIYVGQTNEMLRVRIRRHLTNRRTDAVAMNVLDPFEVCYIEVWPLPEFQNRDKSDRAAKAHLDALEYAVFQQCIGRSTFKAVLNEKDPPKPTRIVSPPESHKEKIVPRKSAGCATTRICGSLDVRASWRALPRSLPSARWPAACVEHC